MPHNADERGHHLPLRMVQPTETERTGRFTRGPAPAPRSPGAGLVHRVLDAVRDARVEVAPRGRVTGWNEAAEELLGLPMPTTADGVRALLAALAATTRTGRADAIITDRDPSEAAGPISVLVVEDDASFRLALGHGLAAEGFAVQAVPSAPEAYRAVEEERFDVILLDWILPGGDGGAVACRALRDRHPEGDVVILTGLSDLRDQRAARDAGASAFLQKGMPLEALCERLRAVAAPSSC